MGESLANDFKRMRPRRADSARQPSRVAKYDDEMAGNYIDLYEGELIGDIYLLGEKGVAAERDALRAHMETLLRMGYASLVTAIRPIFRKFPYRRRCDLSRMRRALAAIAVDTSDMDPTQMSAYNFATPRGEIRGRR